MANTTANYGNDSIRQLKDEERVRLRPAVIFGSDGLDGCAHAAFEISVQLRLTKPAKAMATSSRLPPSPTAPFRSKTTAAAARSTGTPPKNASTGSLYFCELYAGGKYNNNQGGDYDFSLRHQRPGLVRHAVRL